MQSVNAKVEKRENVKYSGKSERNSDTKQFYEMKITGGTFLTLKRLHVFFLYIHRQELYIQQYSPPSVAEMDITSSGSGYERH